MTQKKLKSKMLERHYKIWFISFVFEQTSAMPRKHNTERFYNCDYCNKNEPESAGFMSQNVDVGDEDGKRRAWFCCTMCGNMARYEASNGKDGWPLTAKTHAEYRVRFYKDDWDMHADVLGPNPNGEDEAAAPKRRESFDDAPASESDSDVLSDGEDDEAEEKEEVKPKKKKKVKAISKFSIVQSKPKFQPKKEDKDNEPETAEVADAEEAMPALEDEVPKKEPSPKAASPAGKKKSSPKAAASA
jgi:hypothetical protein